MPLHLTRFTFYPQEYEKHLNMTNERWEQVEAELDECRDELHRSFARFSRPREDAGKGFQQLHGQISLVVCKTGDVKGKKWTLNDVRKHRRRLFLEIEARLSCTFVSLPRRVVFLP